MVAQIWRLTNGTVAGVNLYSTAIFLFRPRANSPNFPSKDILFASLPSSSQRARTCTMFSHVRELMGLMRMPTAPELAALQAPAPLMMLFGPERQTTMLDDFLLTVLDESFPSKTAADAVSRDVCNFPTCCDRSAQCTG
jgi:hypothetical protein